MHLGQTSRMIWQNECREDQTKTISMGYCHCWMMIKDCCRMNLFIWAATWQNQQSDCASSEDSDQPWHPPSLIRVFAVHMKKALVISYPLSAPPSLGTQSLCWFLSCHSSFGFTASQGNFTHPELSKSSGWNERNHLGHIYNLRNFLNFWTGISYRPYVEFTSFLKICIM